MYDIAYSDSLYSIPPDGLKLDAPNLKDASGRNRTGVTLLRMCVSLTLDLRTSLSYKLLLVASFLSGELVLDFGLSKLALKDTCVYEYFV